MMRKLLVRASLVLLVIALLAGGVYADWKITNELWAWDDDRLDWRHASLRLYLNTELEPFYIKVWGDKNAEQDFDLDLWTDACGTGTSTPYAGSSSHVIGHTKDQPGGTAIGFSEMQGFMLIDCGYIESGPNKEPQPGDILYTCTTDNLDGKIDICEIVSSNEEEACPVGNCTTRLVSTLAINLDNNCNNAIDDLFKNPGDSYRDVCLYYKAVKPPKEPPPVWETPLQARIGVAGAAPAGDRTVNFSAFYGPTAITLIGLNAVPSGPAVPAILGVVALAALVLGGVAVVYRRRKM